MGDLRDPGFGDLKDDQNKKWFGFGRSKAEPAAGRSSVEPTPSEDSTEGWAWEKLRTTGRPVMPVAQPLPPDTHPKKQAGLGQPTAEVVPDPTLHRPSPGLVDPSAKHVWETLRTTGRPVMPVAQPLPPDAHPKKQAGLGQPTAEAVPDPTLHRPSPGLVDPSAKHVWETLRTTGRPVMPVARTLPEAQEETIFSPAATVLPQHPEQKNQPSLVARRVPHEDISHTELEDIVDTAGMDLKDKTRDGQGTAEPWVSIFASGGEGFIRFAGRGLELLVIYIINMLLMIITLGIYSFWAKTRIRHYLWGKTRLWDEPLEYTGTGWELFRSFLIVAAGYVVLSIAMFVASLLKLDLSIVISMLFSMSLVLLWPFAIYSALRYRMSRTLWRGIRGHLAGSALKYSVQAWLRSGLIGLSLGLYAPYCTAFLTNYVVERASFGTMRFRFAADVKDLSGFFYKCWGVGLCCFIMLIVSAVQGSVVGIVLSTGTFALLWFLYQWKKLTWRIEGLRLGMATLESRITLGGYMALCFTNGLLILCTLGIGLPWAQCRRYRYLAEHIFIHGELDWSAIAQDITQDRPGGEGLIGVLDLDLGF